MRQFRAFTEMTVECDRCHCQVGLDLLHPTAHGYYCERCVIEMPRFELDALLADGAAIEAEFAV